LKRWSLARDAQLNSDRFQTMERIAQGARACLRALALAAALAASVSTVAQPVTISPPTVPSGTAGVAYSQTFTAAGGLAPYVFSNEVGRLPNGLGLTSGGALTGTPLPATVPFEVWVTDFNGRESRAAAGLSVITYAVAADPNAGPGIVGQPYGERVIVTGGTPPYACVLASGTLPPGLTLNADCTISGTPQVAGTFSFTVNVTDSVAGTATIAISLVVAAAPLDVSTMPWSALLLLALAMASVGFRRRREA
jgi:large repetitive protein